MRNFEICDIHGHFLPGIDDGSASVAESLQMLEMAASQGISHMCATPQYYPVETVDEFLARRNESFRQLARAMAASGKKLPKIRPGAEVAYRQGIGNAENLEKLCLGESNYLLLELPFAPWKQSMFRDISSISNVRGLIPIIAHVERYIPLQSRKNLQKLLEQDVVFQMNAEHLLHWTTRGKAKSLIRNGVVHLLGSDCHNLTTRKPNLGAALNRLQKSKLDAAVYQIAQFSMEIFEQTL